MTRDEMIAMMAEAMTADDAEGMDAYEASGGELNPSGGPYDSIAAAALDAVLAAGERRWLCRYWDEFPRGGEEWGPEPWSTCHHGHEINDGLNKDRGCGWVLVLPDWREW